MWVKRAIERLDPSDREISPVDIMVRPSRAEV
jgi:hypothetical protein